MSKRAAFFFDRRALLVTGLSTVALGACSSIIGPPEPAPLYMLKGAPMPAGGGPRVPWQVSVVLPDAPDSLDTARIALVQPGDQLDYYANSSWQDRLPFLVQSALLDAFESSGRITSVGRDTDGLKSDYLLLTDIHDFQARYDVADTPPTAVIKLSVKLIAARTRTIAQATTVGKEVPTTQNSVPAVVAAFNQALGGTMAQTVSWALNAPMPARQA
ncbi:MAG TPA: ABC-type transport auxiliary lipoprotein family protein [Rhizomicrobium sp.]|jgi:cholesterol transport system auxiliary component|nr:ABC-type transport auxiliary lipoprotein family protein [Rhizomicrobium sp.]